MNTIKDGGPAFPVPSPGVECGMTLRDYFADGAPPCPDDYLNLHKKMDVARNPHNDSYKPRIRSDVEIRATYAFEWADAMLAAREVTEP